MNSDVQEILFDPRAIQERVSSLAEEINEEYEGKSLLLIGILKGCMFFMADLVRKLKVPVSVDFMSISSYGKGAKKSGVVRIIKDLEESIEDRHVLIVEDIVDTGLTLGYLMNVLKARSPASLHVCALLDRPEYRIVRVPLDYKGFEVGRQFVVGYGLDYQGKYRHLPSISVLKKEVCAV